MQNENSDVGQTDLAVLLQEAGEAYQHSDWSQAATLYQQALTYLDDRNRGNSPEGALCLQNLSQIYHQAGQSQLAIPLYERLLVLGEQILGRHHPDVIATAYRLATAYEANKMPAEAEAMYKRTAGSAERTYGLAHPTAQKIRDSLLSFLAKKSPEDEFVIPSGFLKSPDHRSSENGHEPTTPPAEKEPEYDFMPPPPPKSVARLRELEKDSESASQTTSGNQREYSTKSGVDFGLLAENIGPSKVTKKVSQLSKKPRKIKNLRYGADSAEEVVEKSLAFKNVIRRFDVIAYLTISVIAMIVFSVVLFSKISGFTSASYEDAVTNLLKTARRFESIDGVSGLEFADQGQFVTLLNDVRHRKIPYVILKGGPADIGTMITSAFIHKEVWYQSKDCSLTGDNGVVLYAQESPDETLSKAMNTFADFLQTYYRQDGTYPSSEKRYKDNAILSYVNPYTQTQEFPSLTTLDLKSDKEFLFPGIKNTGSDDDVLQYLRQGGAWRDPRPPKAGRVCALGLRHGVEKRGDNYWTTEIYIMAYDKDLRLISGGLPGLTYVIGLKDGKLLSAPEADRQKDVEQASVHPPDRICIVRGDTDNVGMMRQAVPTTLVIIFIGAFLGFLFLEFKNRKANPQLMPQTFEVVGGISLALLLIIWLIHIWP